MSVDLTNATRTIPSSRFGLISSDGDQSVSLNTFSGTGTFTITQGINTTPNGIGMSAVGIAYDNGTTTTSTSWDDITNRIAQLSAIAPNGLNATLLAVNNTISVQNADTAPTRVINTSAEDGTGGTHFGVAWVGNTLPFVMETLDATPLQVKDTSFVLLDSVAPLTTTMTATDLTSGVSTRTWADIIASSGSSNTLDQVLTNGNESDLSIVLKDDLTTPTLTNTIGSSSVSITGTGSVGSVGFSVGDVNVNGTATGIINGTVNSSTNLGMSNFSVSTAPFFQPSNTTINLTSTPSTASLGFTSGGQFVNAKTMDLTLDGITHTSSSGGGNFTISTTDDLLLTSDNLNMSATALTIPKIGQPITAQLNQDGLTMVDTTNGWNTWYRKASAYIANTAGTIYSFLQFNLLQFITPNATNSISAVSMNMADNNSGAVGLATLEGKGKLTMTSFQIGGVSDPMIDLISTHTGGSAVGNPTINYRKRGNNGTANALVATHNFFAKNYLGAETLFGKIESVITNSSAPSGDDGALDFYTCVNGVSSLVMRLNGADNENNSFRPLDMNGNAIKTNTGDLILTASTTTANSDIDGSTTDGNITFTANTGAGGTNGFCFLTADRGVGLSSAQGGSNGNIILDVNNIGDLQLEGTTLISPTSGGNSGQHLRIKLNGTYYKIALQND